VWPVTKRSVVSFFSDQGTQHAAALTYYALMSLFPTLLLAVSLLGLLGDYPATYNAIVGHLRSVVPTATLAPLSDAVRAALRGRGTAASAFVVGSVTALYGATGYLAAARRALDLVFDAVGTRGFMRRKLIDAGSTLALLALVLGTLTLIFAGAGIARETVGSAAASVWLVVRWPGAFACAMLVFSFIYTVTPGQRPSSFRLTLVGAAVGVCLWLAASAGFSAYLANFKSFNVTYGSFAAAIILLVWLWLTNVALLLGAEINVQLQPRRPQHAVSDGNLGRESAEQQVALSQVNPRREHSGEQAAPAAQHAAPAAQHAAPAAQRTPADSHRPLTGPDGA
jgi:membrane protein